MKAFAPGNLSCFFEIVENGSLGAGFTVDKGVVVDVSEAKTTQIFFNKEKIDFPTVESVINKLTDKQVTIKIDSELPLSVGFGISGACAIATAYALNSLLNHSQQFQRNN